MAKNVGICYYMSMTLKDRIPKEFYSLFRTKNMDAYMQIVVALYEENNEVYASLGLTREECQISLLHLVHLTRSAWHRAERCRVFLHHSRGVSRAHQSR